MLPSEPATQSPRTAVLVWSAVDSAVGNTAVPPVHSTTTVTAAFWAQLASVYTSP